MKWSKYQLAIFDAYENTNKNIIVEASAGSGKTQTLKELCNRTPKNKSCLFMAFNKSIAEELKTKLPYYVDCYTFHALGLRTMMKNFRFKAKVNDGKCFKLCTKLFQYKKMEFKERMKYFFALQTLWEQVRLSLCKINEENIVPITIEFDLDYEEEMIPDLLEIEKAWRNDCTRINNNLAFEIDFVDMLWIPYTFLEPESFPKYNVVMADECQDFFTLQKNILQNLIKPRGRFVGVGDSKQLIYNFLGSDLNVFNSLKNNPNTTTLPLSVTYRCSKRIVEEANKVFPGTECAEEAKEGIVRKGELNEATNGDFVLCRNNLPLVAAFLQFLKAGKKSSIMGRDFGENICRLMENQNSLDDMYLLLDDKEQKLIERGINPAFVKNHPSYVSLEEKVKIVELLYESYQENFSSLKEKVRNVFSGDSKGIILSTIHKSKGLEANRVFFLNPELLPSKYAKTPKALYAEECLKFVAITRAKEELVYCHIDTDTNLNK